MNTITSTNKTVLTIVLALVIGSFLTHQVDNYVSNHDFVYQSPIILKSPVIITQKLVSPIIMVKEVVASPSAEPVAGTVKK